MNWKLKLHTCSSLKYNVKKTTKQGSRNSLPILTGKINKSPLLKNSKVALGASQSHPRDATVINALPTHVKVEQLCYEIHNYPDSTEKFTWLMGFRGVSL